IASSIRRRTSALFASDIGVPPSSQIDFRIVNLVVRPRQCNSNCRIVNGELSAHSVTVPTYAAPDDFEARNANRSLMLMPESSSEIICSDVTPTCCPYHTSFSATSSNRIASFSSKSVGWLPTVMDCGDCGVAIGNLRAICGGNFVRLAGYSGIYP